MGGRQGGREEGRRLGLGFMLVAPLRLFPNSCCFLGDFRASSSPQGGSDCCELCEVVVARRKRIGGVEERQSIWNRRCVLRH